MRGVELAAVDVYRVAEGLERVERDADGQDQTNQQPRGVSVQKAGGKLRDEEVIILEDTPNTQV